jgi:ketosteroid isomerase-like protein
MTGNRSAFNVQQSGIENPDVTRVVLDKQEIHEVLMRYCRGLDRCDKALLLTVVQPDAVFVRGSSVVRGDEVVKDLLEIMTHSVRGLHTICNELIEVYGDTAYSECYWVSYSVTLRDGQEFTSETAGRYVDRWERREDRLWKIAYREFLIEWSRSEPAAARPLPRDFRSGTRSSEDPSYHLEGRPEH